MQRETRGQTVVGKVIAEQLVGGELWVNGNEMLALQARAIDDLVDITGGESPTETEHNLVIDAVNEILAALRGAGILLVE
jgi:hypothetical protein